MAFMPLRCLFVGVGKLQNKGFASRWAADLQSNREPIASEPTGHGDRRQTIFVKWRRIPERESSEIGDVGRSRRIAVRRVECRNRRWGQGSCWRDYRIHGLKRPANFLPEMRKFTLRHDVIA